MKEKKKRQDAEFKTEERVGKSLCYKMIQVLLNLDTIKYKISAITSPGYFLPSTTFYSKCSNECSEFSKEKKLLRKWPYIYSVSVLGSTTVPSLILSYIVVTLYRTHLSSLTRL